jgi:hypothetical protein
MEIELEFGLRHKSASQTTSAWDELLLLAVFLVGHS